MSHEEVIRKLITDVDALGRVKARERNDLEYKESFGLNSWAKYAKTMAAFANNRGGYIVFGVKDNPREIVGVSNGFSGFNQEKLTESINSLFSPEIIWETGTVDFGAFRIGYIYTEMSEAKPVMALRNESSEKISSGDVYYRYRARSEKIKFPEMQKIINDRAKREREQILKLMEAIRKSDTTNLGIINYNSGRFSTPYGADIAVDKKLVLQVLRKAKYIKKGSFDETTGTPVLKVSGTINLAEEVPVPDIEPDVQYPYIQKQLAEKLEVSTHDLYALIWHYQMKGVKKYHMAVSTSSSGKNKTHKFSDIALQFLAEEINSNKHNPQWLPDIREAYRQRKDTMGVSNV